MSLLCSPGEKLSLHSSEEAQNLMGQPSGKRGAPGRARPGGGGRALGRSTRPVTAGGAAGVTAPTVLRAHAAQPGTARGRAAVRAVCPPVAQTSWRGPSPDLRPWRQEHTLTQERSGRPPRRVDPSPRARGSEAPGSGGLVWRAPWEDDVTPCSRPPGGPGQSRGALVRPKGDGGRQRLQPCWLVVFGPGTAPPQATAGPAVHPGARSGPRPGHRL